MESALTRRSGQSDESGAYPAKKKPPHKRLPRPRVASEELPWAKTPRAMQDDRRLRHAASKAGTDIVFSHYVWSWVHDASAGSANNDGAFEVDADVIASTANRPKKIVLALLQAFEDVGITEGGFCATFIERTANAVRQERHREKVKNNKAQDRSAVGASGPDFRRGGDVADAPPERREALREALHVTDRGYLRTEASPLATPTSSEEAHSREAGGGGGPVSVHVSVPVPVPVPGEVIGPASAQILPFSPIPISIPAVGWGSAPCSQSSRSDLAYLEKSCKELAADLGWGVVAKPFCHLRKWLVDEGHVAPIDVIGAMNHVVFVVRKNDVEVGRAPFRLTSWTALESWIREEARKRLEALADFAETS